jgi:tRNA threonylcarbamoyladenosine biosynthesis protein TsaB
MTILNIETSTSCCSAAITIEGKVVAHRENLSGANHASELPVFIEQLLAEAKTNDWRLDAVALSEGPGSYTGLRIGASLAKGLCYGLNIPLIPVDTLQILCAAALAQQLPQDAVLCPMLDARRMEVYTSIYTRECARMRDIEAKIIDEHAFEAELAEQAICFFGNGAAKCKEVIQSPNAYFIDDVLPQAQYMGTLAEHLPQLDIKQVAYYEPFYLKEFVAAPSHIKGLETK